MKLILGDSLEELHDIPNESVDLIVTSPPYDKLRTYRNSLEWNPEIFKKIAGMLAQKLKAGGVLVWVVGDATVNGSETGTSFEQALYFKKYCYLNLHDTMIYKKDSCPWPETTRYYPVFEYMFVFSKGKVATFNPIKDRPNKWYGKKKIQGNEYDHRGDLVVRRTRKVYEMKEFGVRHNVWEINTGCGKTSKEKIDHPAMFPEKLAHDHILSWSNEGDTVLDSFMGSGTVGKMAKKLNRNFIGIEKVEKYFEIAKQRIGE